MEKKIRSQNFEENLEIQLDQINSTLKNTLHELEVSDSHIRNPSLISYIHSNTSSYSNFNNLDLYADSNESSAYFEENSEELLKHLNRALMQIEDFSSDTYRKLPSPNTSDPGLYAQNLEAENQRLRISASKVAKSKFFIKKNLKLEQERKNFEEKLSELDFLVTTYKTKHTQILVLDENLRIKESLLNQKEKQLRKDKEELDKSKRIWETSVINNTIRPLNNKKNTAECQGGEPPSQLLSSVSDCFSELDYFQQNLRVLEMKYKIIDDLEEKCKLVMSIDQLKNKIASIRGQQAVMICNRSSKMLSDMRKAIEKEVSYEEGLRKSNLEKFSIKSASKMSMTPNFNQVGGKRFLFE